MQERKLKTLTGRVISNSGNKSIRVAIDFIVRHPKYGKYIRRRTKLGVHDERNQAGSGDLVEVWDPSGPHYVHPYLFLTDAAATALADVMTPNPVTITPQLRAIDALRAMSDAGFLRMPTACCSWRGAAYTV